MTALPPGHGRAGALARLAKEGGAAMAGRMTASPNHPSSIDRWIRQAREEDPSLDDGQAAERAEQLQAEYYRRISAAGVAARRAKTGTLPGPRRDIQKKAVAATVVSPRHLSSPQRWPLLAREQNPDASEEEITRIAAELRTAHYRRIWETRRANASAAAAGGNDSQATADLLK